LFFFSFILSLFIIKITKSTDVVEKVLDGIDIIVDIYKNFKSIKGYSRIVYIAEIKENNFNLEFNRYNDFFIELKEILKEGKGKRLKNVLSRYIIGTNIENLEENKNGYPYIRISNLNSDIRDVQLTLDKVEEKKFFSSSNKKILSEKAMILSLLGKFKPTIFSPHNSKIKSIIPGNNIIAIITDEDVINIEYLYYQFYEPKILKQLEFLKTGSYIPRIRSHDLLNLILFVPDLKTQKEYIRQQKHSLIEIDRLRFKEEFQQEELRQVALDAEENIISMLVHNSLPRISEIDDDLKILQNFLEKNNMLEVTHNEIGDLIDDTFEEEEFCIASNMKSETIKDVIDRTKKKLKLIMDTLVETKKTVQVKLDRKDFEEVNLYEFLQEIRDSRSKNNYEIKISQTPNVLLKVNKFTFRELFIQLIDNAESHGFEPNDSNKKYKIEFMIKENKDKDFVEIIYSNNGKPFNFTKEMFITAYKKSKQSKGTGLGGNYIYRVLQGHNGEFDILERQEGVKMRFIFPKGVNYYEK